MGFPAEVRHPITVVSKTHPIAPNHPFGGASGSSPLMTRPLTQIALTSSSLFRLLFRRLGIDLACISANVVAEGHPKSAPPLDRIATHTSDFCRAALFQEPRWLRCRRRHCSGGASELAGIRRRMHASCIVRLVTILAKDLGLPYRELKFSEAGHADAGQDQRAGAHKRFGLCSGRSSFDGPRAWSDGSVQSSGRCIDYPRHGGDPWPKS